MSYLVFFIFIYEFKQNYLLRNNDEWREEQTNKIQNDNGMRILDGMNSRKEKNGKFRNVVFAKLFFIFSSVFSRAQVSAIFFVCCRSPRFLPNLLPFPNSFTPTFPLACHVIPVLNHIAIASYICLVRYSSFVLVRCPSRFNCGCPIMEIRE